MMIATASTRTRSTIMGHATIDAYGRLMPGGQAATAANAYLANAASVPAIKVVGQ
jgi:hypothetical protein